MSEILLPWKGTDLIVAKHSLVSPFEYSHVSVLVGPGVLPSTSVSEISNLHVSTRSRNAQSHLAMLENAPSMVAGQIAGSIMEDELLDGHFVVNVPVRNFSPRPILIPEGIPLARFYRQGEKIVGEELGDMIADKKIEMDELILRHGDMHKKGAANIIGATLRIDSAMRKGILPSKAVLDLSTIQGEGYREKIDANLVTLPETDKTMLWIGSTGMEIGMSEGIDAVLRKEVYSSPSRRNPEDYVGEHIPARLLDGGKKWLIRVEVWGKILKGMAFNYIDVDFYRAAPKAPKSQI